MAAQHFGRFAEAGDSSMTLLRRRSIAPISVEAKPFGARNRKFESIPLQQTVRLSPDFPSAPEKARVFRHCRDQAGQHGRQRRTKLGDIAPQRGSVSAGRNSSTAVADAARDGGALASSEVEVPRGLAMSALSSVP